MVKGIFCVMDMYKYFDMEVRWWTDIIKEEYMNVHFWEVDLSKALHCCSHLYSLVEVQEIFGPFFSISIFSK